MSTVRPHPSPCTQDICWRRPHSRHGFRKNAPKVSPGPLLARLPLVQQKQHHHRVCSRAHCFLQCTLIPQQRLCNHLLDLHAHSSHAIPQFSALYLNLTPHTLNSRPLPQPLDSRPQSLRNCSNTSTPATSPYSLNHLFIVPASAPLLPPPTPGRRQH